MKISKMCHLKCYTYGPKQLSRQWNLKAIIFIGIEMMEEYHYMYDKQMLIALWFFPYMLVITLNTESLTIARSWNS